MSRYIDADKLGLYLNDIALTVAPTERDEGTKRLILQVRYETLQAIIEDLDRQPTADVKEIVRGEWIAVADEIGDFKIMNRRWIKCNQCNEQMMIRLDAPLPNFCPNCGAKMDMRGEENAE